MAAFAAAMREAFGDGRLSVSTPLAPFTTFKVGGPAEWFIETRSSAELVTTLKIAHAHRVAVTLLGGGSNVLVADSGVRGLVVRPRGGEISKAGDTLVRAE